MQRFVQDAEVRRRVQEEADHSEDTPNEKGMDGSGKVAGFGVQGYNFGHIFGERQKEEQFLDLCQERNLLHTFRLLFQGADMALRKKLCSRNNNEICPRIKGMKITNYIFKNL